MQSREEMARVLLLSVVCLFNPLVLAAHAGALVFPGSGAGVSGVTLNALAIFDVQGSTLRVVLRNVGDTSGTAQDVSANQLTGLFFSLPTGYSLTPLTATVAAGAIRQGATCVPGPCATTTTNVGGEFAHRTASWYGHTGNQGISSAGYIGYTAGNFGGPNLDDPTNVDGINFAIVAPASSNPLMPDAGLATEPLIENEVVFTLTISGGALIESQISNVTFQYGKSLYDPRILAPHPYVPEPAVVALLLVGVPLAWAVRARRRALAA